MTDKPNPAIIPILDPRATAEESEIAHGYLVEYTPWPLGYDAPDGEVRGLASAFAAHRVAAARQAVEWAAKRVGSQVLLWALAAHDKAIGDRKPEGGND